MVQDFRYEHLEGHGDFVSILRISTLSLQALQEPQICSKLTYFPSRPDPPNKFFQRRKKNNRFVHALVVTSLAAEACTA